jgi:RNA polymerase sigma factor (sigma-70 family)
MAHERLSRGLTLKELVERLGLDVTQDNQWRISTIERGRMARGWVLDYLCAYYQKEPEELFDNLGPQQAQALGVTQPATLEVLEQLAVERAPQTPEALVLAKERAVLVRRALRRIKPRDRDIVCRLYGIGHDEGTLDAVGQRYGVSRERVRQIRNRALDQIRNEANSRLLRTVEL